MNNNMMNNNIMNNNMMNNTGRNNSFTNNGIPNNNAGSNNLIPNNSDVTSNPGSRPMNHIPDQGKTVMIDISQKPGEALNAAGPIPPASTSDAAPKDVIPSPVSPAAAQKEQNSPSVGSGIKVRLVRLGRDKDEAFYEFMLVNSLVIGRDSTKSQLVFKDDEALSGKHCELTYKDSMIFVQDLGSTNGTYVNGIPVSGVLRLHKDDILLIGSMELRIYFNED
jgi:FOG: FHA domain